MFSVSASCTAMAACVVVIMMMIMAEVTALPKHSARDEIVPLQLNLKYLDMPKAHLANSSISPWTYNISRDDTLYPPHLSEARCLLQGCLDSEGQEDLNLESRPIMHEVLLLRRMKPAGAGHSYNYKLESRFIAVGCTCVRPIVRHQQ